MVSVTAKENDRRCDDLSGNGGPYATIQFSLSSCLFVYLFIWFISPTGQKNPLIGEVT